MASSARIHPTAIISPEAEFGDNVEVGAHVIIEGKVRLGADCIVKHGSYLFGPITMGRANTVYSGAILGEKPQHLRFKDAPTTLEIGDGNTFRESVTVHRGTTHSMKTVIGNDNYFMVNCHVAHDCVVGNRCVIANGALIAGHCIVGDSVFLSGNCAIHQFVRIGKLALMSACSITTKDVPPFTMHQGVDNVVGLNLVGLRRAGMSHEQINSLRSAFRVLYRQGLPTGAAIERIEAEYGDVDVVQEVVAFLKTTSRGINPMRDRHEEAA